MKKEELIGKNEFWGFRVESQSITQSSQIAKAKGTPWSSPPEGERDSDVNAVTTL